MDFFDSSYYKWVKTVQSMIGRWVFQTPFKRYFFTTLVLSFCIFLFIGEVTALIVYIHDIDRVLESIPPIITDVICAVKYANNVYNFNLIKDLLIRVRENWSIYTNEEEQNILHSYSNFAKVFNYGYVGLGYTTTTLFISEPILPRILGSLMNLNETIPIRYPTPVYWYGIDLEEDYYYVMPFSNVGVVLILVINSTMDILFITLLQHAAALFEITGYIMEQVPTHKNLEQKTELNEDIITTEMKDIQYKHYIKCIKCHEQAIKFAEDLESVYVWCLGIIITLNVIMLSVTATQVATQAKTIEIIIKLGIFAFAQLLHIFIYCYFSQRLISNSECIQEYIYSGVWYECTPKTQKFVPLVTLRSQVPCKLTAGKIVVLSMETFTVIVKTSASYFTVLMSMQ